MPSKEISIVPRGTETVLLVEPEPETRKLAAFMLEKQGYQVLEARSGVEAMHLFDQHQANIDLLLTEVLMSKLNGHELASRLKERKSSLQILYMSDSEYGKVVRPFITQKGLAFLQKPFTMRGIASKVRQVLDAAPKAMTAGARLSA